MTHQIGTLAAATVPVPNSSAGESTAAMSAATLWKPPAVSLKCKVTRTEGGAEGLSPPLSPCRSPVLRADLSAACQAFTAEVAAEEYIAGGKEKGEGKEGVPLFVMMPLDSVKTGNAVNRKKAMNAAMAALKSAGVEGVMMDVWWGLVEREKPGEYNWGGYVELMEMAKKHGLKVQAVMSFHQCGGNVGDSCT